MMTNEQVLAKMEDDFILRNLSERTRQSYRFIAERFLKFSNKEFYADLNQDDLRAYLLHMRKQKVLAGPTSNQYNSGCKFLLVTVLGQQLNYSQVPNMKTHHKPQRAFTIEELKRFFSKIDDLETFAYFLTLYGCGLRMFECCNLTINDIHGKEATKRLHIEHGKGDKARDVILPDACYKALQLYWKEKRLGSHCKWIFQASDNKSAAKTSFFSDKFNSIRYLSIIPKELHPHCLRIVSFMFDI